MCSKALFPIHVNRLRSVYKEAHSVWTLEYCSGSRLFIANWRAAFFWISIHPARWMCLLIRCCEHKYAKKPENHITATTGFCAAQEEETRYKQRAEKKCPLMELRSVSIWVSSSRGMAALLFGNREWNCVTALGNTKVQYSRCLSDRIKLSFRRAKGRGVCGDDSFRFCWSAELSPKCQVFGGLSVAMVLWLVVLSSWMVQNCANIRYYMLSMSMKSGVVYFQQTGGHSIDSQLFAWRR